MADSIFLIDDENALTRLERTDYDSEALLQRLLADHPAVLGVTDDASTELLLIKREQAVPDDEGGSGRWSLDHLFVDRESIPVLVEVKRATDTRARREVVAQMLDYAANGVSYWPLANLIEAFQATCHERGENHDEALAQFLGEEADSESFWQQVETNLRAGRIRMVFVADRIHKDLRRIVEFLNEQMRTAEISAVEVAQFTGADGLRTLVPTQVGLTERARSAKRVTSELEPITKEEWLDRFQQKHGEDARKAASRVIDWAVAKGCSVGPSKTQDSFSISVPTAEGKTAWPFFIRHSNGRFETSLQYLQYRPAFSSEEARQEILNKLNTLPGVTLSTQKPTGWPGFPAEQFVEDDAWKSFEPIAEWIMTEVVKGE